ncbi:MAG: hypothetical protein ACTSRP_15585, partial [Candidatus Helarchaeota archaeon]
MSLTFTNVFIDNIYNICMHFFKINKNPKIKNKLIVSSLIIVIILMTGFYPAIFNKFYNKNNVNSQPDLMPVKLTSSAYAQKENVVVICVEFSNRQASSSTTSIESKMNNVVDYYSEISYGLKNISFSIASASPSNDTDGDGWYELGTYSTSYTTDAYPVIKYAIKAADPDIDYSKFPHIIIVVAGNDYAQSHNPS